MKYWKGAKNRYTLCKGNHGFAKIHVVLQRDKYMLVNNIIRNAYMEYWCYADII